MRPEGVALPRNEWDRLDGVWPTEPPTVSVIVAHFEQQAELDRTLRALSRQDHPAERLEIVVVDDGSATPPRVPTGVRLVVQEDRGFRLAAARNAGAAVATGQVLCFVDADTAPEPGYVRELTRLPALAPDVVTVGRRRHADLAALPPGANIEQDAEAVALADPQWLLDAYAGTRDLLGADDRAYRFVIGAVVACDAAFFRATGGFDESFTEYGGEDWEWAYRAWLAGAVFAHVPLAVAWHDGPEWSGRSSASVERKNAEALRLADLVPVPGSGWRGLRAPNADVGVAFSGGMGVVTTATAGAEAAWLVCRDTVAAALPRAAMPGDGRSLARSRILIDVVTPVRVSGDALQSAVDRVVTQQLASLTVVGPTGSVLCVVRSTRAAARAERWGRDDLFESVTAVVPGIDTLPDEVDVEGYLGGWA